jgi:hypothetical protein
VSRRNRRELGQAWMGSLNAYDQPTCAIVQEALNPPRFLGPHSPQIYN